MRAANRVLGPISVLVCALLLSLPSGARAQRAQKPAAEHFARAVSLFNEGDLRAALVEFQKAYELAPNPSVLYNIGQVHYQLQEYAAALKVLTRFLAEASPSAANRMDAESTVETLRSRVGQIWIRTNVDGAELLVDDEVVGRSPLSTPVIVSVGRRRVVAQHAVGAPASRVVDVAGGETVTVKLDVKLDLAAPAAAAGAAERNVSLETPVDPRARRRTWRVVSWSITGALAAGALVSGLLALKASSDLETERDRFGATPARLADAADRSKTLALATDVLIGAAIVSSGISLYLQLTAPEGPPRPTGRRDGATPGEPLARLRLSVSPTSVALAGRF